MEKLLLHHCCAPCSPQVLETLSKEYDVVSFWFNPNIQPIDEHNKRKDALSAFLKALGRNFFSGPDSLKDNSIWSGEKLPPESCRLCYYVRLSQTAEEAKKSGIKNISTTLLSSPHQKHEDVKFFGEQAAKLNKINFVYRDFRPFYYEGKKKIKDLGLYSQRYCGCLPSLKETDRNGQK